ncbi:2-succinyl-5-enolpyruvyl-6-hydroxy-3-cyclohexene-1-carboxylate synthase isoform X4 [Glycine max]|uniref:2-succinyl-5-enolpyruvyl-6-hydroxy-3- cyclohexene-1-carboxylate synthase isoform X4 n=1 Tax=Glycine max TaxID=3847 RepID=UPI001B356E5A|nr:2-succinyl-5-enolpyruvyl-6-hydroxy-3-cyclohexene-1-carboxylate synthase isoform X4 [Glycine max]XP_040872735.1 2-succinyl-5-enolpyruvyl-6-hydroxy-3-cyclohexene-1-carboxylate synthase isoform X4 [Glycine max]
MVATLDFGKFNSCTIEKRRKLFICQVISSCYVYLLYLSEVCPCYVCLLYYQLDHANELSNSLKESANINTVWASLIVEECTRLGLMYLCIAPGSRPSPVAVAVASHKLITCISCFDERSLAYHAVGYGRGSHIPAVAITSSGTAVSNLLPAIELDELESVSILSMTLAWDEFSFSTFQEAHYSLQDSLDQSPKKVNLVAALVRGMLVKDASMQLESTIKRAAKTVYQVKEFHRRVGFEVASADKMAKSCMVYFEMHLSLRKKIITKAFNGSYSIYKETFCNQVYCLFV